MNSGSSNTSFLTKDSQNSKFKSPSVASTASTPLEVMESDNFLHSPGKNGPQQGYLKIFFMALKFRNEAQG